MEAHSFTSKCQRRTKPHKQCFSGYENCLAEEDFKTETVQHQGRVGGARRKQHSYVRVSSTSIL